VLVSRRRRLLVVSPRFLFPLDEGGKIRTANILRRMKGGAFELDLCSPAPLDAGAYAADLSEICDHFDSWPQPRLPRVRQLFQLAQPLPLTVSSGDSPCGRAALSRAFEQRPPDVVLVDFAHAAVLVPEPITIPAVVFTHNVEAEILERQARISSGLWRIVWRDQARKMRAFEKAALRRFDYAIAVSVRDADRLKKAYGLGQVAAIDTGVDLDFYGYSSPATAAAFSPAEGTVVFTGAMDWRPNIDAVEFLMEEIWPRVIAARPGARAVIVGRNPSAALALKARKNRLAFAFTGFVEDIRPYVAASHVYAIPLRAGSGTRIKVFEAMAMGRPVVSTRIGVEGLEVTPEEHYLAADRPDEFAEAILRLLGDAELRARLAGSARRLLERRFSWAHVARQVEDICLSTLDAHPNPAHPNPAALAQ
jgi:polysaccharide biosynthesis protein PslH